MFSVLTDLAGCVALKLLGSIVAKTAPVGRIVQTHFSDLDAIELVYTGEPIRIGTSVFMWTSSLAQYFHQSFQR